MNLRKVNFSQVKVGEEFWWGGYKPEHMNWGRKRSSRTADWAPSIQGVLSDHVDWGYWKQNEVVYIQD